jgi:hypothetical protein
VRRRLSFVVVCKHCSDKETRVLKIFRSRRAAKNASARASALVASEPHIIVWRIMWYQQMEELSKGPQSPISVSISFRFREGDSQGQTKSARGCNCSHIDARRRADEARDLVVRTAKNKRHEASRDFFFLCEFFERSERL